MAVAANYMWIEAAARSNLGTHAGALLASAIVLHGSWHLAASDESNAFTVVVVPEWMQLWCSAPPVRARDIRALLPEELKGVAEERGSSQPTRACPWAPATASTSS